MTLINKLLSYFKQDGLLHILVSLVLCAIIAAFLPLWASALISIAVGGIKELIWDLWLKKGTAEWRDIISDTIGILIGTVIIMIKML